MQGRRLLLAPEDDVGALGFLTSSPRTSGLSNASSGRFSVPRLTVAQPTAAPVNHDNDEDDILPASASTRLRVASPSPQGSASKRCDNEESPACPKSIPRSNTTTNSVEADDVVFPKLTLQIDGVLVAQTDDAGAAMLDEASLGTFSLEKLNQIRLATDRVSRKLKDMISRRQRGDTDSDNDEASQPRRSQQSAVTATQTSNESSSDDSEDSSDESYSSESEAVYSDSDFGSRKKRRGYGRAGKAAKKALASSTKRDPPAHDGRNAETLTKTEIQALLRQKSLPVSGRKSELVRRWQAHQPLLPAAASMEALSPPADRTPHTATSTIAVAQTHASPAASTKATLVPRVAASAELAQSTPFRTLPLPVDDATPVLTQGTRPSVGSHRSSLGSAEETPTSRSSANLTQRIGFVTPSRIYTTLRDQATKFTSYLFSSDDA